MVKCDKKASEIHHLLHTAWGDDIICERQVRRLVQEMRDGERDSIARRAGSGRPRTSITPENINAIRELIGTDPHLSKSALSRMTDIPETTVQRIIVKEFNMHSVCARWIPHKLNDQQKQNRVAGAALLLREVNGGVMVIDEKWLYKSPMPARQNVRMWVSPDGDRPEIPRRIISDEKFHIIVACNFRGEHYSDVLPRGEHINADRYIQFLDQLKQVRRGNLTIMHDNARPHKARITEAFLQENSIGRIPQPAYSPDMNLLDRLIFRNMESERRDRIFNDICDAQQFVEHYLQNFSRRLLRNELLKLRDDLQTIINAGGSYL